MASGPLLADHFQLPCLNRAMASTDSNREAVPGSIGKAGVGFTTGLLHKRGRLERIAGPNVASPGKGLWHGKFSSFCIVERLLRTGGERHASAVAIAGRALMSRGEADRHHKGQQDIAK